MPSIADRVDSHLLTEFCLGVIKKFKWKKKLIKKELKYIELLTQKKIEILQFSFTSFQILNCYMIVHYEYLLPLWVVMTILFF